MWGDSKEETSTSSPPGLGPVMSWLLIGFFLENDSPVLSARPLRGRRGGKEGQSPLGTPSPRTGWWDPVEEWDAEKDYWVSTLLLQKNSHLDF